MCSELSAERGRPRTSAPRQKSRPVHSSSSRRCAHEDRAVEDVGRGQVLALQVALVGLRGERAHAVALQALRPIRVLVLDLEDRGYGVRAGLLELGHRGVEVRAAKAGRRGLHRHDRIRAEAQAVHRLQRMLHDRDQADGVGGQLRRPHERHLRAPLACGLRDLLVFRRDDDPVEPLGLARRADGPGDERTPRDVHEVLARDRLRPASGRDDGEYLPWRGL